jgi:hypothetical protein
LGDSNSTLNEGNHKNPETLNESHNMTVFVENWYEEFLSFSYFITGVNYSF